MKKKLMAKKEKIKQARLNQKRNRINKKEARKSWGLMVIDDAAIRKQAFSTVKKTLKTVERLESQIEDFHEVDLSLYNDWYKLTFRDREKKIVELSEEYSKLADFHNDIISAHELYEISIEEAYLRIREESDQYKTANSKEKASIEEERQRRREYGEEEMERVSREESWGAFYDEEEEEFGAYGPDGISDPREFIMFDDAPERTHEEDDSLKKLRLMSDSEIKSLCRNEDLALQAFGMLMYFARTVGDFELLFKLWDFIPKKTMKIFEKSYNKATGQSLSEHMGSFREILDEMLANIQEGVEFVEEQSEDDFEYERKSYDPSKKDKMVSSGEIAEKLKLYYRKIVKRLHPDTLSHIKPSEQRWRQRLWERAVSLRKCEDLEGLVGLYTEILLRSEALSELSLADVNQNLQYLKEKTNFLKQEIKVLKKRPWWGFSRKRSFDKLKMQVQKDFSIQEESIQTKIEKLRATHKMWEYFSKEIKNKNNRINKSKGRRSGRGRRQSESAAHNDSTYF